ncbi:MAG: hypothetical protein C0617_16430 [Desulfuromonas sp.]|uniref:BatD family protein n=1 Tax=Desulfuromonas sp. TaxID=892 RepID=UPI000CB3367D|nr:BatD family protein [Desulfuromonas sp.]PLX81677.1 MAG: hypothetical protein C0617_16430 [Desulfuromonas sp.]
MVTLRRTSLILFALLVTLLSSAGISWAGHVRAWVDRNPVGLDESFRLILEADGSMDAAPDFAPLERDFEILGQNQSSSFSFVNGSASSKKTWTLTLMAKAAGDFRIPSIPFGSDPSPALSLSVNATPRSAQAQRQADLFLEVEAEPKTARVQQQILYVVRLLRAVDLGEATLSEPAVGGMEAVVEKLGEDRSYETMRDGRRFLVIERRYALFPQQSGTLSVEPILFEGRIASRRRSMLDPFAAGGPVRRLRSEGVSVEVQPVPAGAPGGLWLPAKKITLAEEWPQDPPAFKAGEPVTRTLTLVAEGLTAAQVPDLAMTEVAGIKQYPDRPTLENREGVSGIVGVRQEKIALVPTGPGRFVLPAVEVPWWNVDSDRLETARLPERAIEVAAASAVAKPPAITPETPTAAATQASEPPSTQVSVPSADPFWKILCLILGFGWAGTALAWILFRRRGRKPAVERESPVPRAGRHRGRLKEACRRADPAMAKETLLAWGLARFPGAPPTSLGQLSGLCPSPLKEEIESLNAALYGRGGERWEGQGLWEAFSKDKTEKGKARRGRGSALEPLYRD